LPDGTTQTIGKSLGTFTVSSGEITGLASEVTNACVGLTYTATFKSAKLAYGGTRGTALGQTKRIPNLALILHNTHMSAITYGEDEDNLDSMPLAEEGTTLDTNLIWTEFDKDAFVLNGTWTTDSRLVLKAVAPKPATVLGAIVGVETTGK
jgi:hypothetical protein